MKRLLLVLSTCLFLLSGTARAGMMDQFFDADDGWLDGSDWVLNNATGFMPIPLFITEPAVGQGLGLALAFFHAPEGYSQEEYEAQREKDLEAGTDEKFVLPDVTAIVAAGTNNGTWLAGGGHVAHWRDDTIRFEPMAGYASVNLKYYFPENILPPEILPPGSSLEFNVEGSLIGLPMAFRIKQSNFFLGVAYDYSKITSKFDKDAPILEVFNFEARQSALGTFVRYDNRDSPFTPTSGRITEISYKKDDDTWGSDWDFYRVEAYINQFWNIKRKWEIGLRASTEYVNGDLPFYAQPYIDLRGIPALRYQGDTMALGETEVRWAFHPRFRAVGFIGVGKVAESYSDLNDSPSRVSKGLGFRYVLARKLGLQGGIDVAKGPEDTYWYLTVGSAWRD